MSIILPISYPTITSFPGRANIYAISENNKQINPWLMENYIQTESLYIAEKMECDIDFFIKPVITYRNNTALESQYIFNPYLEVSSLDTDLVKNGNIINFIKMNIERGYYISIGINTGYVKAYDSRKLHPVFIYGFDNKNENFYIADFFRNGKYGFEKCTFKEMKEAIDNYDEKLVSWGGHPYSKSIISLIRIDPTFSYTFNQIKFIDNVLEYLNHKNNLECIFRATNKLIDETPFRKFGNLHYDNMFEYIDRSLILGQVITNFRLFHVFYDHKIALRQRVEYLLTYGYNCIDLLSDLDVLVKEALIIRNKIIKNSICKNISNLKDINIKLYKLKNMEYEILSKLLDVIK